MVIVHPEFAMLILEINDLRDEIADLTVDRDMIKYYICRNLQIDYMLKIESLEYKLAVEENRFQRNKLKIDLINNTLEKDKDVDMEKINKKIEKERKKHEKIEKSMLDDIDFAIEITEMEVFDYEMIDQMNLDYFKIQKKYNPFLDLEEDEKKIKNYKKIENYYKKFNYKKIHKLAEDCEEEEFFQDEISNLKLLRDKYLDIIAELRRDLRKLKNTFPYNQKAILEDENLCRRKKDKLNRKITELNEENKDLEKRLDNILKKL